METVQPKRIYFDAEDRPPPSYWSNDKFENNQKCTGTEPSLSTKNGELFNNQPVTRIDPEEWLKAPEFVPRSRKQHLVETFNNDPLPSRQPLNNVQERLQPPSMHRLIHPVHPATAPFAPARTIIDMPQPVLSAQGIIPFHLGQSTAGVPASSPPYFIPAPSATLVRYPISAINPTTFALRGALGMVPPGYSANITHINSAFGPPIPAVILKKKRRKRHRRLKAHLINAIEKAIATNACIEPGENLCEKPKHQLQAASSEPNLNKISVSEDLSMERSNSGEMQPFGGSCPDLSDSQLMLWDNYLFEAVVNDGNQKEKFNAKAQEAVHNQLAQQSEYEVASRPVLAAIDSALHVDGISSQQIRQLDCILQGKGSVGDSLSEDGLVEILQEGLENRFLDSPASTTRSLKAEFEELSLRPSTMRMTQYGYPQANFSRTHMATFNPEYNTVTSAVLTPRTYKKNYVEEDCFEGVNVRLNAFDEADNHLTEPESSELTRFQQIQWALQQNAKYYMRLAAPDNMCCNLM